MHTERVEHCGELLCDAGYAADAQAMNVMKSCMHIGIVHVYSVHLIVSLKFSEQSLQFI